MANGSVNSPLPCVGSVQRDEADRISGDTADASDIDGAAKDSDSRETEKDDTAHVGVGEQTLSVEQEAPPAKVRGCLLFSLFP